MSFEDGGFYIKASVLVHNWRLSYRFWQTIVVDHAFIGRTTQTRAKKGSLTKSQLKRVKAVGANCLHTDATLTVESGDGDIR